MVGESAKLSFDIFRANTPTDGDNVKVKEMKKPITKKWWFWVIVVLVVFGVIGALGDKNKDKAAPASSSADTKKDDKAAEEAKKKADDEAAKKAAEEKKKAEEAKKAASDPKEMAKKSASEHFGSAEVEFNSKTGAILITAPGSDNFTNNMIKRTMWMHSIDTLKDLKDVAKIKEISFNITFPLVDKYGNESTGIVMKIKISNETKNKINFENFNTENLPEIADYYWAHPSFSE